MVLKVEVAVLMRPNFCAHLIILSLCKPFSKIKNIESILLYMLELSLSIDGVKVFNINNIMHLIIQMECLTFGALLEFQRHGHLASWLHYLFGAVATTSDFHFFEIRDGFADVLNHVNQVFVEVVGAVDVKGVQAIIFVCRQVVFLKRFLWSWRVSRSFITKG